LDRTRYVALAVALLILIAITRILLTYKVTAQGFDEPCHVAAAIEYLDKGTYILEISHPNIAIWTSADMSRMSLPPFETPRPFQPVAGWVAISLRSRRMGDLFHDTYPPGAFAWLGQTQPVARIGKTILLYYIPPRATAGTTTDSPSAESR
jgi:hypothetical protein